MNNKLKKQLILLFSIAGVLLAFFILMVIFTFRQLGTQGPATPANEKEAERLQGESDVYFSKLEKNFYDSHPWYNSLPKQTEDYFVGYDPSKKEFFADVYSDKKNPEVIKQEVSSFLKSIGVNLNQYNIVFTTRSRNP